MPVVIGRINQYRVGTPDWDVVREAQVAVAESDPCVKWIDTDDLKGKLHYQEDAYQAMGKRFAESIIELIKE